MPPKKKPRRNISGLRFQPKPTTVSSHTRAKCAPVCPFENDDCCMAHILSKQDDFANQISVLETVIREAGHECIFLPKFHCELNPIEMVSRNCSSL